MSDIWERYHKIQNERTLKMRDAMEEYDKTVYRPQMSALQKECEKSTEGHNNATFHDNGLGWHWWYCGKCGASHSQEKYATYLDDEEDEE